MFKGLKKRMRSDRRKREMDRARDEAERIVVIVREIQSRTLLENARHIRMLEKLVDTMSNAVMVGGS